MPPPSSGLRGAVAETLIAAYDSGRRLRSPAPPHEPDLIVGLITRGVPMLRRNLSTVLRPAGLTVRVAGVYCHGNPKVEQLTGPEAGSRCELGDLLVVTRHRSGGRVVRNALLTQFKISTTTYGATPAQAALYAHWPQFEYWRTRGLTGDIRNSSPKIAHPGAQFAEFGPCRACGSWNHPDTRAWYGRRTSDYVDELVDLILGFGGRRFALRPPSPRNIGWSRIIEDLLEVTARRTFSYAGKLKGLPAGTGDRRALTSAYMLSERCIPSFGPAVPSWFGDLRGMTSDRLGELAVLVDAGDDGIAPPEDPFAILDDQDDDRAISVLSIDVDVV